MNFYKIMLIQGPLASFFSVFNGISWSSPNRWSFVSCRGDIYTVIEAYVLIPVVVLLNSSLGILLSSRRDVADFNHTYSFTSLCPCNKECTNYPLTGTMGLSALVIKESHRHLFKEPHLIHQRRRGRGLAATSKGPPGRK